MFQTRPEQNLAQIKSFECVKCGEFSNVTVGNFYLLDRVNCIAFYRIYLRMKPWFRPARIQGDTFSFVCMSWAVLKPQCSWAQQSHLPVQLTPFRPALITRRAEQNNQPFLSNDLFPIYSLASNSIKEEGEKEPANRYNAESSGLLICSLDFARIKRKPRQGRKGKARELSN